MLASYGSIGLFFIAVLLFTLSLVIIPIVLRLLRIVPHHPDPIKGTAFECGVETIGKTWVQFNFRYYGYALIFLALDVLVVFLYPWAAQLRQLGLSSLIAVLVLVAIVLIGYLYAWKKKALEWK